MERRGKIIQCCTQQPRIFNQKPINHLFESCCLGPLNFVALRPRWKLSTQIKCRKEPEKRQTFFGDWLECNCVGGEHRRWQECKVYGSRKKWNVGNSASMSKLPSIAIPFRGSTDYWTRGISILIHTFQINNSRRQMQEFKRTLARVHEWLTSKSATGDSPFFDTHQDVKLMVHARTTMAFSRLRVFSSWICVLQAYQNRFVTKTLWEKSNYVIQTLFHPENGGLWQEKLSSDSTPASFQKSLRE